LDVDELRELCGRVSYKPGWQLTVHANRYTGGLQQVSPGWPVLTVDVRLPNSYRDEPISLRIESPVPPVTKPGEFVRWLQNRLLEIEIHERDEMVTARRQTDCRPARIRREHRLTSCPAG